MSEPNEQDESEFPFLRLPFLAMRNAVRQMAVLDIYKLSKSSRVCKNRVKQMNLKTKGINVHANDKYSSIHVIPNYDGIRITTREQLMKNKPPAQYFFSKKEDISCHMEDKGPKEHHVVPDHLVGCTDMAKEMNQLIEMETCAYDFLLPIKSTEETINLMSRAIEGKCNFISLSARWYVKDRNRYERVIDKRIFDYLMDNLNLDVGMNINAFLPNNYNHENLFKFQENNFNEASWVTIELLKSLRNVQRLTLLNMNLNSKDINEFISYVANCEEDMVEDIRMSMNRESTFKEDEILDQLTSLRDSRYGAHHLIKVRYPKNRKRILMQLRVYECMKTIHLVTIEKIEDYKVQLEILELMEKAKELEGELLETEEREKQVGGGHLMERKEAIRLELAEIRQKLFQYQN
ncbi:unnamed protein product [Caenorhabditis brenneri]